MVKNEGPTKEQVVEARTQDRLALQIGRMVLAGFSDQARLELAMLALKETEEQLAAAQKRVTELEETQLSELPPTTGALDDE